MEKEIKRTTEPEDMPDFESETQTAPTGAGETNPYEAVILAEMERRAETDPQLASGLRSPEKSVKECWKYVTAQARKEAKGSCAMVRDDVVYGWAVHYYTESPEAIAEEMKPKFQQKAGKKAHKDTKTAKAGRTTASRPTSPVRAEIKPSRAVIVPMPLPKSVEDARKASRAQAKAVEQMDLGLDW